MGMEDAIIFDWDDSEHPYPLSIIVHRNKLGIRASSHRNQAKAGLGIWCGAEIAYWEEKNIFPWLPKWLYLLAAIFSKPDRVKCWKKWWKYCYLELKELAMIHTGRWFYVYDDWLWVLRTFDGKLMVFRDEDDIPKEINKESMTRYQWDEDENAYVKYVPPPPKSYTEMLREMMSVVPYLTGC